MIGLYTLIQNNYNHLIDNKDKIRSDKLRVYSEKAKTKY